MTKNSFKIKYAILGAIIVPCFGRVALHGTGSEYDFYRYLIPFLVGSFAGFFIGYMKEKGGIVNEKINAKNIRLEQEIKDRIQLEQNLRQSEKRFKTLFTDAPDAIFIIDLNDNILDANRAATHMLGYTNDEFKKMTVDALQAPEVRGKVGSIVKNELSHGKIFEGLDVHKNGTIIPLEIHNHKMTIRGNEIVLSTLRDISDRKAAEKALRKSEEEIKSIFRVAPTGIGVVVDRVIHQVNDRVCKMTGYTRGELIGQNSRFLYPTQEDFEYVGKEKYRQIRNHGTGTVETRWQTKSGETIQILMSSTPIDQKDYSKGVIFTALDITELRMIEKEKLRLEKQLRQAQKMEAIGTLAGGIAHDFNNILFPIMGNAELLLEDIPENNPMRGNVNGIYSAVIRAKELVQQILTFSRQEKSELRMIKIQPILNEAVKMMRSTIPTTIDINTRIEKKCCAIKADPTQIHQIIINLMTNAFHAMEEHGGVLRVHLTETELKTSDLINLDIKPGRHVCLVISDTGIGIDKELKEKIFDPYFTTKEKGKGTGIGLSVVHGIVSSMGGAIQVYSEPGKGTKFRVYFPIKNHVVFKNGFGQDDNYIPGGTEQILLVDDEVEIVTMEKQMLERLGYRVSSFVDSTEALETFRAGPDQFDLVITDLAMPKLPGDKLATELTTIRPDIPILLNTGFSDKAILNSEKNLGIKAILIKPIVMKDLAGAIRKVLDETPHFTSDSKI